MVSSWRLGTTNVFRIFLPSTVVTRVFRNSKFFRNKIGSIHPPPKIFQKSLQAPNFFYHHHHFSCHRHIFCRHKKTFHSLHKKSLPLPIFCHQGRKPWRCDIITPETITHPTTLGDAITCNKTSQELRMLSSVTLDCQVTKIVMNCKNCIQCLK